MGAWDTFYSNGERVNTLVSLMRDEAWTVWPG